MNRMKLLESVENCGRSDLCEMLTDRQMDGQTDGRFAMMIAHADL